MSYVNIYIHAVWRTKHSNRLLNKETRYKVLEHIKSYGSTRQIFIDTINAEPDHVHCLFKLNADMPVSKAIGLLKGESSNWINKTKLFPFRFEWAIDYYAASVSLPGVDAVRRYIANQEQHHHKESWEEALDRFLREFKPEEQG